MGREDGRVAGDAQALGRGALRGDLARRHPTCSGGRRRQREGVGYGEADRNRETRLKVPLLEGCRQTTTNRVRLGRQPPSSARSSGDGHCLAAAENVVTKFEIL